MVRHIVWWHLKPNAGGRTADENIWHIHQASSMLHGNANAATIEVSNKVQPSTTVPAMVVLCTSHKDMDAFNNYVNTDIYKQFTAMVDELATACQCLDYVCDMDQKLE